MRLLLVGLNCTLHTLALLSMQATALSSAMLQSLTVPSSLPLRNLVGSVYSSNGQQLTYMLQVRAQEVGNSSGQGPWRCPDWSATGATVAAQILVVQQDADQVQHDSPSMPAFVQCGSRTAHNSA